MEQMKQLIAVRLSLMTLFRKTSFLYGAICGLAFMLPLMTYELIPSPIIRIMLAIALLFAGLSFCARRAEDMMKRFNDVLYTEIDPERFVDEFTDELYTRKPEKWNIVASIMLGQAYHAMGSFKEEEAQYIRHLNAIAKSAKDEVALKNELAFIGRMVILYADSGNAEAAEKAFARFRKAANEISEMTQEPAFEDLKNLVYNCYLKVTGKTEECIGYFEWRCENCRDELSRVLGHYRLAEAYEAGGYTEDAEKEYRIVAEQGKKLYCAEKAREKLAALCIDGAGNQ